MALPKSTIDRERGKFTADASGDTAVRTNLTLQTSQDDIPITLDSEKVQITDGLVAGQMRLDGATESLITIDHPHHEVHDGHHFYLDSYVELDSGVELRVKLVTPDTTAWAHLTWDISSSTILTTQFYEGASGGMAGGSGVTPLNNDRNSGTDSGLTITSGVETATSDGTLISQNKWGSRQAGGEQARTNEIILKQDTIYLRKFISGANANIINFRANWYECTNKN